jgi:beta-lactamase regulating signal transducer with metallopeptidase domain
MTFEGWPDGRMVQALGWTLVHFLWQGAAAAVLLAIAGGLVARRSPNARYALGVATLVLMAALPLLTFVTLMQAAGGAAEARTAPLASGAITAVLPGPALDSEPPSDPLAPTLPMLVGLWALGVAVLSVRVAGGWTVAQRLARSGRPVGSAYLESALTRLCAAMRIAGPVRLLESARIEVPTVIGWIRPVILFPAATLAGLTPAQLEVVLAHELAHIRRLDYLVNLLQTAVETLLFYHPAVWWVSHRVRVEREHCCDDAAVAVCGDAVAYARALADLEGLRVGGMGLAMAADGGSLIERVGRLVGQPQGRPPRASRSVAAALALAAVPALLAGPGWIEARAQAVPEAASPSTPESVPDPEAEPVPQLAPEPAREPRPAAPARSDAALTIEQVLELAHAGVTPEYLDEMAAAGLPSLSWDELIELRSQGVGPEFVKGLKEQGLTKLSVSELIELRSQGVGPEYVQELKAAGYADLSSESLMNLRSQGVSGEYARELKELGYDGLSTTKLIALRSQGVNPEYVRELQELGYAKLSIPVLLGLRSQGVTPDYVRELKDAGWSGLSPEELIELRSQGVGADLLRRLRRDARPERR